MRTLILALFFVFSHYISAQDTVSGNLHAVINPDGSITYYLKVAPGKINKDYSSIIKKSTIQKLVGSGKNSPKAFQVVGANNEVAGYYVTRAFSENVKPIAMAISGGYKVKALSFDSLPESFGQVYKLTDQTGKIGGAWLPVNKGYGVSALGVLIPNAWSTSKVGVPFQTIFASTSSIPVPKDDFIESLRESMLRQAISLACKSKVIPKEIAVSASLAASVGFIVGGEGTISFEATWDTTQLCKP